MALLTLTLLMLKPLCKTLVQRLWVLAEAVAIIELLKLPEQLLIVHYSNFQLKELKEFYLILLVAQILECTKLMKLPKPSPKQLTQTPILFSALISTKPCKEKLKLQLLPLVLILIQQLATVDFLKVKISQPSKLVLIFGLVIQT